MHPPTQDRHRVENYRRLWRTPTTDTQQKQRCKRTTTPSRRHALTDAAHRLHDDAWIHAALSAQVVPVRDCQCRLDPSVDEAAVVNLTRDVPK